MQVWIGCPQFHEIGVWTTHKLMHEHVGKHAKMQRSKEGKHTIITETCLMSGWTDATT